MLHSKTYLPNDLGLLLTYHNKVTEDNYTVLSHEGIVYGEVYGYLLNDPEVIQRRLHQMNLVPSECRYGLWAGECFTGVTSNTKETMLAFVQGSFYRAIIGVLGLDYDEEQVHQLINDFDAKLRRANEKCKNFEGGQI